MTAKALESAGFCASTGELTTGLVAVNHSLTELAADEAAVVRQAAAFEYVDFVFFRRFDDNRSSRVCAYVVDNDKHKLSNDKLANLHAALWLHGVAPLIYVTSATRIDILTCARGPDFWSKSRQTHVFKPAEQISLASSVERELKKLRRFQAFRLADGTFWDDPRNAKYSKHRKAAHETLIQAIVDVDAELGGDEKPILRRLLLLMVLIKYLEDRSVFPSPGWFGTYCKGARSFFEVLKEGTPDGVLSLLRNLQRRFNGDVFDLPPDASQLLTESALRQFAELVEARTIKKQRYLWELHSFEHIPVEIISHLYNRFLKGKGQVYTPPFLASLILDYAMPYEQLRGDERVLDPACGSGVFLVGAYRRLVNVWRKNNNWKEPNVKTLKRILSDSIFGVERDPTAVDLTAFSLSLAVCDALKPNVIWKDLNFDRLRNHNIFERDFFDCLPTSQEHGDESATDVELGKFDVIVGNPPFESKLSESGNRLNEKLTRDRGTLPDKQAAYLFLEQALTLLKPKAAACLLQPYGFLYNQKTFDFRSRIIRQSTIEAILDFVSIRNLFDGADTKPVAILVRNQEPDERHRISHFTFRRTYLAHQRLGFELDHYDCHQVPQGLAASEALIWRINLLGGGRLFRISDRLRHMRSLQAFVESKGWIFREGFIIGNRKWKAPFLTGSDFLPTNALTINGIGASKINTVTETHFEAPRIEELFQPALVLIKEHISLPCEFWDHGNLTFRHEIVGIHASTRKAELRDFCKVFKARRSQYVFICLIHSSRALLAKATAILKADIAALPYPEENDDLAFAFWEKVIQEDTLDYIADFIRLGQNSALLRKVAGKETVGQYAKLYRKLLGSVYENLEIAEPVFFDGVICQPFFFGKKPEIEWLDDGCEEHLRELVHGEYGTVLRTNRVVRFYDQNVVFVVKPDRLRYWIRSTAIRDADDTLVDLQEQGY
ncbi:MAG: N-6 DNA methylase [Planctomycetes bacterium]|nr:N-6 DNA methylase [Planctomycetota bacterium]